MLTLIRYDEDLQPLWWKHQPLTTFVKKVENKKKIPKYI